MNYFIEGLQGSGKSTFLRKLSEARSDHKVFREGDYSPVELAWCAYVKEEQYEAILKKYPSLRAEIREKSYQEGDRRIICYTRIKTDVPGFYQDLEQYEIYNGRMPEDEFLKTIESRFLNWNGEDMIFECSLFQNIVEDMILFRDASDEAIMSFYRKIRAALSGKAFRIIYLRTPDIEKSLGVIRKERSDEQGNEVWFPLLMHFFNNSPYAKARKLEGEAALFAHLKHRQELELKILREVFPDKAVVLESKAYSEETVQQI